MKLCMVTRTNAPATPGKCPGSLVSARLRSAFDAIVSSARARRARVVDARSSAVIRRHLSTFLNHRLDSTRTATRGRDARARAALAFAPRHRRTRRRGGDAVRALRARAPRRRERATVRAGARVRVLEPEPVAVRTTVPERVLGRRGAAIVPDVDRAEPHDRARAARDRGGVRADLDAEPEFSLRGAAVDVRGVRGVGVRVSNRGWNGWETGAQDEEWVAVG